MSRLRPTLAAALLLAGTAMPAAAQTLRIAFKASMDGTDPHQTFTPNRNAQLHVWETLLTQDATLRPQPLLATSWRAIDPLTWEFTLRRDAVFHVGASWGLKRGLVMTPRGDQYTMATEVRPAP